jgi:outer membrane lipoprotein SlyB
MNVNLKVWVLSAIVLAIVSLIAGCAQDVSGSSYSRDQTRQVQEVEYGTVESVRQVQIQGSRTPLGAGAGAVAGGIAGSTIGHGKGSALAALGGALLGGAAGAAVEEGVTREAGLEVIVRLDDGRTIAVTQGGDEIFGPGERVRVLKAYNGVTRISH